MNSFDNAAKMSPAEDAGSLKATLAGLLGPDRVRDDDYSRRLHSQDIWSEGPFLVPLVVAPQSVDEISKAVCAIRAAGYALAPRGGGMSYTSGYVANLAKCVSLDLGAMNRILDISAEDMTVTVEAGCTWQKLHEALKPLGLRTPFWGTMSGLAATVGGGISNLTAMLGAGHHGTASESVVALTVVVGDGQVIRTGARGIGKAPFYRHYGPDLAGLFCGDAGAFGIKAEITLRLIRTPAFEAYASFSFKTGRQMLEAMGEMARCGIASEMCAFDPGLTRIRMQRTSLISDVKTLGAVVKNQKSLAKGLLEIGKIAMAGRDFIAEDEFPLHVIAEGRCAEAAAADIEQARRIAARLQGHEIENTIAKVIRAQPFPPLNGVLGPRGERWAPIHGFIQVSQTATVYEAIEAVFAAMAPEFERHGIHIGYLFSSLSTNALIIEPVFYWPEARTEVHALAVEAGYLSKLPQLPRNPAATAVVAEARKRVIAVFEKFGCGHLQIGRTYPYAASRDAVSLALLKGLRDTLDPDGVINPGALGLGGQ